MSKDEKEALDEIMKAIEKQNDPPPAKRKMTVKEFRQIRKKTKKSK